MHRLLNKEDGGREIRGGKVIGDKPFLAIAPFMTHFHMQNGQNTFIISFEQLSVSHRQIPLFFIREGALVKR